MTKRWRRRSSPTGRVSSPSRLEKFTSQWGFVFKAFSEIKAVFDLFNVSLKGEDPRTEGGRVDPKDAGSSELRSAGAGICL